MATNLTLIDSIGPTGELQYARRETFSGTVAATTGQFSMAERRTPGGIGTGNYFASAGIDSSIERIEVRAVTAQTSVSFDAPGTMRMVYSIGALANGTGGGTSFGGVGPIVVNHNTGGTDNLTVTALGIGQPGVLVSAYLQTDYAGGNVDLAHVKGQAITDSNGHWSEPMGLAVGSYAFTFTGPGIYYPVKQNVTVA